MSKVHSPFLHYLLVPSIQKVNIGNAGSAKTTLTSSFGYLYFQYLLLLCWKPVDNAKMVNACVCIYIYHTVARFTKLT